MSLKRITMADVARHAGVSKATVSFVLNDRPGLAAATRARVLAAAEELGWTPSAAARTLSGKRTDTIGVVLNRPPRITGVEPALDEFFQGVERELSHRSISLLMRVVPSHAAEMLAIRTWWYGGRVDGVVLVDLREGDDRPEQLSGAGIRAVGVGDPAIANGLLTAWRDEATVIDQVVGYLATLGHQRIARLSDRSVLSYAMVRNDAFRAGCHNRGLGDCPVLEVTATPSSGAQATRELLLGPDRPSAIVYDNTVTAMAGLAVAHEMGVRVPEQLSIVAWGDSEVASHTHPTLSCIEGDGRELGGRAARMLLDLVAGTDPGDGRCDTPRFVPRGSTAPV